MHSALRNRFPLLFVSTVKLGYVYDLGERKKVPSIMGNLPKMGKLVLQMTHCILRAKQSKLLRELFQVKKQKQSEWINNWPVGPVGSQGEEDELSDFVVVGPLIVIFHSNVVSVALLPRQPFKSRVVVSTVNNNFGKGHVLDVIQHRFAIGIVSIGVVEKGCWIGSWNGWRGLTPRGWTGRCTSRTTRASRRKWKCPIANICLAYNVISGRLRTISAVTRSRPRASVVAPEVECGWRRWADPWPNWGEGEWCTGSSRRGGAFVFISTVSIAISLLFIHPSWFIHFARWYPVQVLPEVSVVASTFARPIGQVITGGKERKGERACQLLSYSWPLLPSLVARQMAEQGTQNTDGPLIETASAEYSPLAQPLPSVNCTHSTHPFFQAFCCFCFSVQLRAGPVRDSCLRTTLLSHRSKHVLCIKDPRVHCLLEQIILTASHWMSLWVMSPLDEQPVGTQQGETKLLLLHPGSSCCMGWSWCLTVFNGSVSESLLHWRTTAGGWWWWGLKSVRRRLSTGPVRLAEGGGFLLVKLPTGILFGPSVPLTSSGKRVNSCNSSRTTPFAVVPSVACASSFFLFFTGPNLHGVG